MLFIEYTPGSMFSKVAVYNMFCKTTAEAYLGPYQVSVMEIFCDNNLRPIPNIFHEKTPSYMFDKCEYVSVAIQKEFPECVL